MKKIIFAITVLFASFSAMANPVKEAPVVVLNTTHDIFYFKICKSMMGGTAEVFDAAGNLVITQNLDNRKLIIDFFEMLPGDYTIKVKKENTEETFAYHRNDYTLTVSASDVLTLTATRGK